MKHQNYSRPQDYNSLHQSRAIAELNENDSEIRQSTGCIKVDTEPGPGMSINLAGIQEVFWKLYQYGHIQQHCKSKRRDRKEGKVPIRVSQRKTKQRFGRSRIGVGKSDILHRHSREDIDVRIRARLIAEYMAEKERQDVVGRNNGEER